MSASGMAMRKIKREALSAVYLTGLFLPDLMMLVMMPESEMTTLIAKMYRSKPDINFSL